MVVQDLQNQALGRPGSELRINRAENRPYPGREFTLGQRPVSYSNGDIGDLRFRGVNFVAIEEQEDVGSDESDPLVSVQERNERSCGKCFSHRLLPLCDRPGV